MNRIKVAVRMLLLALCLLPCAALADATGSTNVILVLEALEITGRTEDFVLGVGEGEDLTVTTSRPAACIKWEKSSDGGTSWTEIAGATAATYTITGAEANTPADVAYQYRVTVSDTATYDSADSAVISVLVADGYSYRTIALRNGDTEVASYMHDDTRLVITRLPESAAAAERLEEELTDGCLPLILYDVSLINEDGRILPYFGTVDVTFHVGSNYNGETLRAFHLRGNTVTTYSGVVSEGKLTITVTDLSPFLVEVPATYDGTGQRRVFKVTVTTGSGGSVTPSGTVNVADGSDKTFTVLPDAGYEVDAVTVDYATYSFTGNSIELTNIAEDATVSVSFRQVEPEDRMHTVTINAPAHGSVYPSGEIQVRHGSAQTIYFYPEVTPNRYEVDKVLVNGHEVNVIGNSYTLSAVTGETTVVVSFTEGTSQPPDVYRTIYSSADANGSISPVGDVFVEHGGDMYFYFIPNDGYEVASVEVDGTPVANPGAFYRFVNVTADREIEVTFREKAPPPTNHTITATTGANGGISPAGAVQVAAGGSQTFSFVPSDNYEIDAVTVDGNPVSVTGSAYTFTNVTGDHEIHVTYKQAGTYHTVTASAGSRGRISPAGDVQVAAGGSQTFRFIPNANYAVDTVTVDGTKVSVTGNKYTFSNVSAAHTIRVTFKHTGTSYDPAEYYTVAAGSGEHGRISPTGSVWVEEGYGQTFYFIPDPGYVLDTVTLDGAVVTVWGDSYRITVWDDHTIYATFRPTDASDGPAVFHTIEAGAGPGGSISPSGGIQVAEGSSAWFYFIPGDGYAVETVTVDGSEVAYSGTSYQFPAVAADHSIYVRFAQTEGAGAFHTVNVHVSDGGGSISPTGEIQIADGGSQTFYFLPEEGYEVDAIYVNGVRQDVVGHQFTVDDVTDDLELRVHFRRIDHSALSAPHCFLCKWIGRNIEPWCWLILLVILAALGGAAWFMLRKRRG